MSIKPPIKKLASARKANLASTLLMSASLALGGLGVVRDKLNQNPLITQTQVAATSDSEVARKIKNDLRRSNKLPAGIVRLNTLRQIANIRIDEGLAKGSDERKQYAQLISEHLIRAAVNEHAKLPEVQRKSYDGLIRELFDKNEILLDIQPNKQLRRTRPNMENNVRVVSRKRV